MLSGLIECPTCGCSYPPGTEICPMDHTRLRVAFDEAPTVDDPLLGKILDGRYQIHELVGRGGMGAVYRARQTNIARDVAVKVVNTFVLSDASLLRRFENEARIISALRHPNTLKLIDFGKTSDGRPYLVTEFLVGRPLERILKAGPVDVFWILRIVRQVVDALAEAHEHAIVHRDLKPENVFIEHVAGDDVVRVLDFGIAKLGQSGNTVTGTLFGTPAYMSPEQARGETADARSDLYSVGVILFRAISGSPPFDGEEPMSVLLQHINDAPPVLSKVAPQVVPAEVNALVMSLLAKDPADRPQSAIAVRETIERLIAGAPSGPIQRPYPTPARGVPIAAVTDPTAQAPFATGAISDVIAQDFTGRAKLKWLGLALLALALGVIGGTLGLRSDEPEPTPPPTITEIAPAPTPAPEPRPAVAVEPEKPRPAPTIPTTTKKKKKHAKKTKKSSKGPTVEKKPPPTAPEGFVDFDL